MPSRQPLTCIFPVINRRADERGAKTWSVTAGPRATTGPRAVASRRRAAAGPFRLRQRGKPAMSGAMNEPLHPALLPLGLRDLLPPDAAAEALVVGRMMAVLESHGYQRVKPPRRQ